MSKSLNFGVIGCGAGGSKLAEKLNKLGYVTCTINTTEVDLAKINIPDENKILLKLGLGGVGKDMSLANRIFLENQWNVSEKIRNIFQNKINYFLVLVCSGGGTGGGIVLPLIELLKKENIPIGVITTLPLDTEGTITKKNALETVGNLLKLSENGDICPLIVADNMYFYGKYKHLPVSKFWDAINDDIIMSLDSLNTLSTIDTRHVAFDSMDFVKCITTEGCMVIIKNKVSISEDSDDKCLVNAIKDSLEVGFELYKASRAASIIVTRSDVLDKLPMAAIDNVFSFLGDIIKAGTIYKGIYEVDIESDIVEIYTLFAGLEAPNVRLRKMKEDVGSEIYLMEEKKKQRQVIDTTPSSEKKSAFEKIGIK